ncbi:MAG: hypothetical protein EBR81_08450, partial [Proteobacteria bacterium]|nr:hypothetical protein [Pseudomonadota bacterium]
SGYTLNSYALRADQSITGGTISIASGGLLVAANNPTISGTVNFGSEALIHIANTQTYTQSGSFIAGSIAKDGLGTLKLNVENPTFTGNIALNQGGLNLTAPGTLSTTVVGGSGGVIVMNGYGTTLTLAGGTANTTFANSILVSRGNALVNVSNSNVNFGLGTSGVGGSLTFGGASGDQGQTINFTGGGSILSLNGVIDLGPAGNAVFYSTNTNVTLTGKTASNTGGLVQGSGTLVKTGASSTLSLGLSGTAPTASNTFTGGILVQAGVLQALALAPVNGGTVTINTLGNNAITLVGGQLTVLVDSGTVETGKTYTLPSSNAIVVTGNATIRADRNAAASSNNIVAFPKLTLGSQVLTVNSGSTYRPAFNSVQITGLANFVTASNTDPSFGNITDFGAGLSLIKSSTGYMFFSGSQSLSNGVWVNADGSTAFSGGVYANPGALVKFGTTLSASGTAQAGIGNLYINPGGSIQLEGLGNINTVFGQKIEVRSTANSLGILQLGATMDPASVVSSNSTGLLLLPTTQSTALNMGTLGDGSFQLAGAATYSATTLGAGVGGVYRIGGNGQNLTIIAANNNVLTGTASALFGSLASAGGTLYLNNTNDYNGGTTVARATSVNITSGGANSPLGSGAVDLFGSLQVYGANGSLVNGGTNRNAMVLHPGAQLQLGDTTTLNADRWSDSASMLLNGASLIYGGSNNTETIGALTYARGSRITINNGTTLKATLQAAGSLTRGTFGTLVFNADDSNFGTNAANTDNFVFSGAAPTLTNGMLPAYMVEAQANKFLTISGSFLIDATDTLTALGAGITAGTDRVALTSAGVTLVDNPVVYALRTNQNINNGAGQFNTITLSGGTVGGGLLVYGANTIQPNIKSGTSGQYELPVYNSAAVTLSGDISANGITKFGTGVLTIGKDQGDAARGSGLGYNKGWVVNEGQLTLSTFGGLGNVGTAGNPNLVYLNASQSGAAQLNLTVSSANLTEYTYTSGRIIAVDNAVVAFNPAAADRIQAINDIEVQSTGGTLLDAQLKLTISQAGSVLQAGTLLLSNADAFTNGGVQINVNYGTNVSESVNAGFSVARLSGSNRLTKWGAGTMYVRGASNTATTAADGTSYAAFTGAISIEQGALQILNATALGSGTVTVKRGGVLDLNTTGYLGAPIYLAGSIERWSVDAARNGTLATGSLNLGAASLQIANDQLTTSGTIILNGGGIEGYLARDSKIAVNSASAGVVTRTLGAGVSFVLAGDSFLGQNITGGVNGLESGVSQTIGTPYSAALVGTILDIKGVISGSYGLTKQGFDTITLSGANTYSGTTNVTAGVLRIGAANAMPMTSALQTRGDAVFDLNGFDQTVGRLLSPVAAVSGLNVNGYIANSATTVNTLTAGSGSLGDASYGGVIQGNIALVKTGNSVLTLTG